MQTKFQTMVIIFLWKWRKWESYNSTSSNLNNALWNTKSLSDTINYAKCLKLEVKLAKKCLEKTWNNFEIVNGLEVIRWKPDKVKQFKNLNESLISDADCTQRTRNWIVPEIHFWCRIPAENPASNSWAYTLYRSAF